jgi:hypothetical protein
VCDTPTNTCKACESDDDCSHIAGKGVCNAGECVQCTATHETACADNSCNPATSTCTTTARGSRGTCQSCLADSECGDGAGVQDPNKRCVAMAFNGAPHGAYCLQAASVGCASPYKVTTNVASLSGAAAEDYCGINQVATTCEALLDLAASKVCTVDTDCGNGLGGLCKNVAASTAPVDLRCTIPCDSSPQCLGSAPGNTCSDTLNGYCK